MSSNTPTPKNQGPPSDLRREAIKKGLAIEADLNDGARRRDVQRRVRNRDHVAKIEESFAYGRRNGIEKLLHHRHGFYCNTDDAVVWFETALPFIVDAAFRSGRSTYNDAVTWAERYVPDLAKDLGAAEIHRRVEALMEIRSKPWPERIRPTGRIYKNWLPTMPEIVAALQVRWEEVAACGLAGWGSIAPPTKEQRLAHDRKRKARERDAKNVRPRSQMTKMAETKALADELGVAERTIRRWRDQGILSEKVAKIRARQSKVNNDNQVVAG